MTPKLYHPVLDCFMRGMPHHFQDVEAPAGTALLVEITGECGGCWHLSRGLSGWSLSLSPCGGLAAQVTIPQELAWRLFTKGTNRDSARGQVEIRGDHDLGERVLHLTAIVG